MLKTKSDLIIEFLTKNKGKKFNRKKLIKISKGNSISTPLRKLIKNGKIKTELLPKGNKSLYWVEK